MSIDNGWRQSKEVRINIMRLIKGILTDINNLIKLQNELIQLQCAETEVIRLPHMEVEVNETSIFEKKEEIKECESNIVDILYTMEIAILDDSDLIFMGLDELKGKIDNNKSDIENCENEIDELREEMEDN
ncbi:hypothetical protein [uncultured Methanobrevibacter sp.]|uniref:hypothetical protein n=1 Tax=uncultured Methanobrevibacter sp. TaxID=253161 RepID=UPI0025F5E072|nr:hypothetical protein [uncultured Methanobrevibacter sp.]